jgi:hypothetical protein
MTASTSFVIKNLKAQRTEKENPVVPFLSIPWTGMLDASISDLK